VLIETLRMVLRRTFEPPHLLIADLAGLVTPVDQRALVEWVRDMLRILPEARLLVLLHRFAGWQLDSSFADSALWLQDDDRVARLAIVGEPEWRRTVLTLVVQPLRRTPIEYFETEAAARRWLGVPAASGPPAAV
jgi:hypothetical protein